MIHDVPSQFLHVNIYEFNHETIETTEFNNETDLASCDCFCGIGVGGYGNIGAGDTGSNGIGRTARFELYGR